MTFYETIKYEDYLFAYYMLVTEGIYDHIDFNVPLLHPHSDYYLTKDDIEAVHNCVDNMYLQSTPILEIPEGEIDQQQVVGFVDSNVGEDVGQTGTIDSITSSIHTGDYDINKFLERPVAIYTKNIPQGEAYSDIEITPWFDFFNTPSVKNKLENYAFIQCDLNIKVVVKCSPFHLWSLWFILSSAGRSYSLSAI